MTGASEVPRGPDGFDASVIVVGLGPVGSVLAALLADAGVHVLGIEANTNLYPLPRAAHVDHEVMRVFQRLGLVNAIQGSLRAPHAYEFRTASGEALLRFEIDATGSPSGWAAGYMIHQPGIEAALRRKLVKHPLVTLSTGARLTEMCQDADGVTVAYETEGCKGTKRARFLVGCDGASSRVRETLGIGLEDLAFDEPWLVIDALVEEGTPLPDINLQICDPARPTTSALMPAGRHRWEFMIRPDETSEQVLDEAFIAALLEPWGVADRARIERKAVYRFHGLLAHNWRERRVLLAGDAAHQMPPFAGQGLCSGVRDAANLAWKLAAVLEGRAAAPLLDTYQTEREPHVRGYVELAIQMGKVVCTLDPGAAAARNAAMLAQRAAGAAPPQPPQPVLGPGLALQTSPAAGAYFPQPFARVGADTLRLDDVLGPGAWLIAREAAPSQDGALDAHDGVEVFGLAEDRLAPFRAPLAAWLERRDAPAVLVRPDRYVFGVGEASDLLSGYARALGATLRGAAATAETTA